MKTIPLTQNKFAIVDDEDFEELNGYKWCVHKDKKGTWYVQRHDAKKHDIIIHMHRQIMNCPDGKKVDHINHNGLDNRKSNLRICTHAQNCKNNRGNKNNTSGFRNVHWNKKDKKWRAKLTINHKSIHVGQFDTLEDAARAVDKKNIELYGEFAVLNFP